MKPDKPDIKKDEVKIFRIDASNGWDTQSQWEIVRDKLISEFGEDILLRGFVMALKMQ